MDVQEIHRGKASSQFPAINAAPQDRKADKAFDRMRCGNQVHNTWTPFTHPDCSQDDIWGINGKRYAKRQMVRRHRLEGQRKVTLLINATYKYTLQG